MDTSENAYFKKFAFKRVNKNNESYIAIFDAIDKKKVENVTEIKSIKKINQSHISNIHAALNNLFNLICQILIEYRKDKNSVQKMFTLLLEFNLLTEKKLFDIAAKRYSQLEKFIEDKSMVFFKPYVYQLKCSELNNNVSTNSEELKKYFNKLDTSKNDLELTIAVAKIGLMIEQLFHKNGGIVNKKSSQAAADELIGFIDENIILAGDIFLYASVLNNNRFIVQMVFRRLNNLSKYMQDYFTFFDKHISNEYNETQLLDTLITVKNYAVVSIYFHMEKEYKDSYDRIQRFFGKREENSSNTFSIAKLKSA